MKHCKDVVDQKLRCLLLIKQLMVASGNRRYIEGVNGGGDGSIENSAGRVYKIGTDTRLAIGRWEAMNLKEVKESISVGRRN